MKTLPAILLTLAVAVPVTWFATRQLRPGGASSVPSAAPAKSERKLLFYQSAMHPWVKSPQAGALHHLRHGTDAGV